MITSSMNSAYSVTALKSGLPTRIRTVNFKSIDNDNDLYTTYSRSKEC